MQKEIFDIQGMHCASCAANIEHTVSKLPSVKSVQVNLLANRMTVVYDDKQLKIKEIIDSVKKIGFQASIHSDSESDSTFQRYEDSMKKRWWLSFLFFIPLFYISMGSMVGLPVPSFLDVEKQILPAMSVQLILTLLITVVNRNYFIQGTKSLFRGRPTMDSLIAIGAGSALIYGFWGFYQVITLLHKGDITQAYHFSHNMYFESGGAILTLVTLGKYIESKSKKRTSDSIKKLISLAPETALVIREGKEEEIPVEEVKIGDHLIIKPGNRIPVDGVVFSGNSFIDESAMTGESMPVSKKEGSNVLSATLNKSGSFILEAQKVGNDTTLANVIRLVEEASASKAPISRLADRISRYFVPAVILIALITGVVWWLVGQPFDFAFSRAISVLIISCPCALGLATPVAIMVGTGKAASFGILIKSGEALELAGKVNQVIFDKTGTLTEGKPRVSDYETVGSLSSENILQLTASLEKKSEHPLAEAFVEYAKEKNIDFQEVEEFYYEPGRGVGGKVDSFAVLAGNKKWMEKHQVSLEKISDKVSAYKDAGKTSVYIAIDGMYCGVFAISDHIKPDSLKTVQLLEKMGIETGILTGDDYRTASAIQKQTGIRSLVAEVLPHDKEKEIRNLQDAGKIVAMVGDGINDAPSLLRADVGIAIGAGSDIAIESADIILMGSKLTDVVTTFRLSRSVLRNIKQNLFWAFFYNIIGIPLAAGVFYYSMGWVLQPVFAAAAMSFSSVTVVMNALRLSRFKVKE